VREVPLEARAHSTNRLQRWRAARFAIPEAIAPYSRPPLPLDAAAPAGPLVARHRVHRTWPATGWRSQQPRTLGISLRPSRLESLLGVTVVEPAPPGLAADQPALARPVLAALSGQRSGDSRRSSVGAARTSTGPPQDRHLNRR
jgi:hypothetical protein